MTCQDFLVSILLLKYKIKNSKKGESIKSTKKQYINVTFSFCT